MQPVWHVAQMGALRHYALARAAASQASLSGLHTGTWSGAWPVGLMRSGLVPETAWLQAFVSRDHPQLHAENVAACNVRSYADRAMDRTTCPHALRCEAYVVAGQRFAGWLTRALRARLRHNAFDAAVFAYNTGCLETFEALSGADVFRVVGQIAPGLF